MRYLQILALPTLIAALLSIPSSAVAQVSINIGAEPVCPYGYYDVAPYNCAPYGYYGPEWFQWRRVHRSRPLVPRAPRFPRPVDNRFDPHHGYVGPHPERGDKPSTLPRKRDA